MNHIKLYEEYISEAKGNWSKIMKGVKDGSQTGPWALVVIKDKKVVHQELVNVRDIIPAKYESIRDMKFTYYTISIEDNEGKQVYSEYVKS
jgi:hypothetical protein